MDWLSLRKTDLIYLAVVLLIALAAIFYFGQIDYTAAPWATSDLYHYRLVAQAAPALPVDVQRPFAHRVLGPYVAGLLPGADPAGFYALTMATVLALAAAFYGYLRHSGIVPPIAAITVGLLLCNRFFSGFNIWDFFQVNDLLSLLWLVALFWSLEIRAWLAFGIVLVLGALTRETAMLIIPVALIFLWEKDELRREWPRLLAACLPALLAFVGIRLWIEPAGGLGLWDAALRYAVKVLEPAVLFRLLINPYIPLILLPLLFWRTTAQFFRLRLYMLVFLGLVWASTLFGANNERLMAPTFLVFYLLIAIILQTHFRQRPILLAVIVAAAAITALNHQWARFPLPSREWTIGLSFGMLLLTAIVALPVAWQDYPLTRSTTTEV